LPLLNPVARILARLRDQSRTRRELFALGVALASGVLLLPWLIWAVGKTVLGPYGHGGALQFWGDFFVGLGHGSAVFWIVALGPLIFTLLVRLICYGLRAAVK
jgi:hypothetical protein